MDTTDDLEALSLNGQEAPMHAGRVCDAIARIGYSPTSALMDIAGNSISAGAKNVRVEILWGRDGLFFHNKKNVREYRIIDDGCGMDLQGITTALQLGSDVIYPEGSLSKYGMGLKSAGFSLGKRISVFSKKAGKWSAGVLDADVLNAKKTWFVIHPELEDGKTSELNELLNGAHTGTIISIEECVGGASDSAKKTIAELQKKLGVTYYYFLKHEKAPVKISLASWNPENDEPLTEHKVAAMDMLFEDIAITSGYDPDQYDCLTPLKVIDGEQHQVGGDKENVKVTVVLFPMDKMKTNPDFSPEQREQIESYEVGRENKGFFIYRNGRMISWGEDLDGTIGRDHLGFRGRIEISQAHDDSLKVDVSKQRLDLPEDFVDQIERTTRQALKDSKAIFSQCANALDDPDGEADTFNLNNDELTEEDPDSFEETPEQKERRQQRTKETQTKTKRELEEKGEQKNTDQGNEDASKPFEKVRYSASVDAGLLFKPHSDPKGGSFVRINTNHSFYREILDRMDRGSAERQTIEAMIWALGAAEILTSTGLDVSEEVLAAVLEKHSKTLSWNIDKWVRANANIFD